MTDYLSRAAVLKLIEDVNLAGDYRGQILVAGINHLPTVSDRATWHCLDNYGGHVNGYECSHCKMPSVEASDFCSSCGCYMRGGRE